jgi:hypothetical protein
VVLVFDSLGYSRKLHVAGLDPWIAEAVADAARDYIMLELVTKSDLRKVFAEYRAKAGW